MEQEKHLVKTSHFEKDDILRFSARMKSTMLTFFRFVLIFCLIAFQTPIIWATTNETDVFHEIMVQAQNGDPQAQAKIGKYYLQKQEYETAINWIKKSAEKG